ncbi:hypothetical protein ATJ97_2520 [Georgenia soli]|uniref:Uncharacterized protein n=1 Tax=Georgenia soli TaxID=638953 RepID=A0A2A9EP36_9MICO|nr:hypothetical protein [Georgenia soli]PFG40000.1 hypothetical protein ATJ97_2520 [Georgenia soli]
MRDTVVRLVLVAMLLVTGVSAMWGGYMLATGAWEMDPAAWLAHTPFGSWTLPGLATMLLPGLAVFLAGVAVLTSAPHHRTIAIAAGVGLIAWVGVELVWMQVFHPVLHPVFLGVGVVVAVLGWLLPHERTQEPAARGPLVGRA